MEVERRERIVRLGSSVRLPKEAELTVAEGWASKRLTAGFTDYVSAWCIQTDSGIPAVFISQLLVIAEKLAERVGPAATSKTKTNYSCLLQPKPLARTVIFEIPDSQLVARSVPHHIVVS